MIQARADPARIPGVSGLVMRPVGYVRSPFTETSQIPKGHGADHAAEGMLEILPDLAAG